MTKQSKVKFTLPFALAIFTGAFLVFQIQPIIARLLLPSFGGTPSVWTTCMFFFQSGLLLGYLYAHGLVKFATIKYQIIIHCFLLVFSLFLLPVLPVVPDSLQHLPQSLEIIQVLATSVGIPFVLLSSSSPLLQYWFGLVHPGQSPYRLYALSNIGSLLALLCYPVIVEPLFPLSLQTLFWSFGFILFIGLTFWCEWPLFKKSFIENPNIQDNIGEINKDSQLLPPSWIDRLVWLSLAAGGSVILLSVTNKLCQDVAVLPFLWVVPLSLYLITFIICFERDVWYQRQIWFPFLCLSVGLLAYLLFKEYDKIEISISVQVIIYCAALFGCCMVCHGEIVRRRPPRIDLTLFYVYIAIGGALGGVFVNFIAPVLFGGYWELHAGLLFVAGSAMIAPIMHSHEKVGFQLGGKLIQIKRQFVLMAGCLCLGFLIWILGRNIFLLQGPSIFNSRNFFGVLHVFEYDKGTEDHYRLLQHGGVSHGIQWMNEEDIHQPTTYYGTCSGAALSINRFPSENPLKIGAVGLGIGTIATYGEEKDVFRFYEINPDVERVAREYFTFIENSEAEIEVIIGDARQTMKQELDSTGSQEYDAILVDAFTGESIPTHLLTQEAFDLYWQHLKEDGILAFHISNSHFNLSDVLRQLAIYANKEAIFIPDNGECNVYSEKNNWVLVTDNQNFLKDSVVHAAQEEWKQNSKPILWTDDFNNLFEILKW